MLCFIKKNDQGSKSIDTVLVDNKVIETSAGSQLDFFSRFIAANISEF